jgi:hypothetical protein
MSYCKESTDDLKSKGKFRQRAEHPRWVLVSPGVQEQVPQDAMVRSHTIKTGSFPFKDKTVHLYEHKACLSEQTGDLLPHVDINFII